MKELAREYKLSLSILNARIRELTSAKINLIEKRKKLGYNPQKADEIDAYISILEDRLKPLRLMQQDTREVTKEVEHYYDKDHWRSPKYTLNSTKSRKYIFSRPVYDYAGNKQKAKGENETIFTFGYHICFDGKTERGSKDVL